MTNCWIIINGALHKHKLSGLHLFLAKSALSLNINTTIIKNDELLPLIKYDKASIVQVIKRPPPDFILFLDKDIILARYLELVGFKVFNSSFAIETCDNKLKTHLALVQNKLPAPLTFFSPFIYPKTELDSTAFITSIEKSLSYPLIIKEAFGSFGEQVYLIKTRCQFEQKITELQNTPFLVQELVKTSYGRDLRLYVVGDKCVCTVLRTANNDFRANAKLNATLTAYDPDTATVALACAATKAVNANFAGVDILFGANGPLVCEVNSNPYILGTYKATAFNVAIPIFKHCLKQIINVAKK